MLNDLSFEVWVNDDGDPYVGGPFTRPVAAFRHFLECLDFVAYCRKVGVRCYVRSMLLGGRPQVMVYEPGEDRTGTTVQAYGATATVQP